MKYLQMDGEDGTELVAFEREDDSVEPVAIEVWNDDYSIRAGAILTYDEAERLRDFLTSVLEGYDD